MSHIEFQKVWSDLKELEIGIVFFNLLDNALMLAPRVTSQDPPVHFKTLPCKINKALTTIWLPVKSKEQLLSEMDSSKASTHQHIVNLSPSVLDDKVLVPY